MSKSTPEITLHHLNASRSDRLFWLLEELEQPYNVRVYLRGPTSAAPPELKEVSSLGKAPVVQIGDQTLTESGYMIHQLIAKYPSSNVDSTSEDSIFWSHFSEGSLMLMLQAQTMVNLTASGFASGKVGDLSEEEKAGVGKYKGWMAGDFLHKQSQSLLDEVESYLSSHSGKYFSGTDKPGEGDFMMFFPINSLLSPTGGRKESGYKVGQATKGWWELVMARPGAKKGMERLRSEEEGARSKI